MPGGQPDPLRGRAPAEPDCVQAGRTRRAARAVVGPAAVALALSVAVAQAAGEATPHVPVTRVHPTRYRATVEVSGQIAAVQSATIAAQRAGVIGTVLFHSGETVTKGEVLLRFDDGVERAQVALDRAKLDQAGRTIARDRKLRAISGVSEAQVETDQAGYAEAAAQLALDTARENRRIVRAPFGGILGIRRVSAGDYLAQGATITTITQTDPLRVLFAVPETELAGIGFGDAFRFTAPGAGGNDGTDAAAAQTGRILALSPQLNATTRARMVEGRIANPDHTLMPGAFGTVTIATGTPVAAYRVPATAVDYGPLGSFVYAVDRHASKSVVRAVYVKILSTAGATTIIRAAKATPLNTIVAIGGFKLQDGEGIVPETAGALQAARVKPGAKS